MYVLDTILEDIYRYIKIPANEKHIIRVHTKKLDLLGELSFPLNIKDLYNLSKDKSSSILEKVDSLLQGVVSGNSESIERELKEVSNTWSFQFNKVIVANNNLHVHLERHHILKIATWQCFRMEQNYGAIHRDFKTIADIHMVKYPEKNMDELCLSNLRILLLKEVIEKVTAFQTYDKEMEKHVSITLTSTQKHNVNEVFCGYVATDSGDIIAESLFKKRSTDMRLMAEHKYGLRIKSSHMKNEYFEKLGKAAVTLELLQSKPRKNMKVAFSNPSSANKDASFILYNCARLAALFRDFNKKVRDNIYPELVPLDDVDFSLLNQAEEWELFYVYIVQYPALVKSCLKNMEQGIINPHYLVSFLCNLCSVFSVYYRRVRILVAPRPHLIPTLHARIYLLKSLEHVFHKTLQFLNIDPIRNM